MDFSHYSDRPVAIAVELVNTLDVHSGEDDLTTPGDVAEFVDRALADWDPIEFEPSERDLHEVRALRSRLREVWSSGDERKAAAVLNSILVDVDATPRVSIHDGAPPHLHFEPSSGGVSRRLGAITAMGLSVALVEGGYERFGSCASATCDDVFIDTTKNRSRIRCSETCTTRDSVAAYRRRQVG